MKNSVYGAYLEDYHYLKIIIPSNVEYNSLLIRRLDEPNASFIQVDRIEKYYNEIHLHCSFNLKICLHKDYEIIVNPQLRYLLFLGKITKTKRFEVENYFDEWLGHRYHKNETTFRVWSPVSKEMYLILNDEKHLMNYYKNGVWEITIQGDLDNYKYYYLFRINEEYETTTDPYGITTNELGTYNYVVDLDSLYQNKCSFIDNEKNVLENMIIYELSVRDFTSTLPVNHKGTFIGMIESLKLPGYGLNYLKNLDITHVQLMPIFEFGGVNKKVKNSFDPNFKYNWGYNPEQYFVPSGWYSTDLEDPKVRINELRMMIDLFHLYGIGVNMDVVFNHVFDHENFSLGKLVPGYVYRTDERGFLTNSSGCGNDLSSEKKMISKFIIDCVLFYQNFYKIDGFRFDLMGLLNVELMNEIYRRTSLNNKFVSIYGEGWCMKTYLPAEREANMKNYWLMKNISFFNDTYRDFFQKRNLGFPKFTIGEKYDVKKLIFLLKGSKDDDLLFLDSNQTVNYIESHDDMTFYDTIKSLNLTLDEEKEIVKLVLGTLILTKGICFIHSGMELLRTKKGERNTYNLSDEYNHFPWENMEFSSDIVDYIKEMIKLRKELDFDNLKYEYFEKENVLKISDDSYDIYIKNDSDSVSKKGIYVENKKQ